MEPALSAWESFYVIVGSSAAALTGLQFVVITLVSDLRQRTGMREIDAFATPTIVHFGAVLLVSAILSAPWEGHRVPGILLGLLGVAGVVYTGIVTRRARSTKEYEPVLEDWIWHVALPFLAYGALVVAAATFERHETDALFAVGGSALLLLFIGIHNAWDTVTWLAVQRSQPEHRAPAAADEATTRDARTPVELL